MNIRDKHEFLLVAIFYFLLFLCGLGYLIYEVKTNPDPFIQGMAIFGVILVCLLSLLFIILTLLASVKSNNR